MTMKMDRRGSDWPPAGWDLNARRLSYRCTTLIQVNSGFIQRTRCLWTLTTSTVRWNKSTTLQWMCPLHLYLSRQTINICGVMRTPFVRVRVPLHCENMNKSQSKLRVTDGGGDSAISSVGSDRKFWFCLCSRGFGWGLWSSHAVGLSL